MTKLPILYTFRRCPYAIRARLAIAYSQTKVELREIELKNKPPEMLAASPKGTVPILILPDNTITIIEESLDIIHWALNQNDPSNWQLINETEKQQLAKTLINQNDNDFKPNLDKYKYADHHPEHPMEHYRNETEKYLKTLEHHLQQNKYLTGPTQSFADIAIFPFIRQHANVNKTWFNQLPYPNLKTWLTALLQTQLFTSVMQKYPLWSDKKNKIFFP